MANPYDDYYQTEHLFGAPYPELIEYYASHPQKGRLLDVGCGQGRDAIALASMGYEVTGMDNSKVGIAQLNGIAQKENLPLIGIVQDMYSYEGFEEFDFILLDSIFHFGKKDRAKEIKLLQNILEQARPHTFITICLQKVGQKIEILESIISPYPNFRISHRRELSYVFEDKESNHRSETTYEMITLKKLL